MKRRIPDISKIHDMIGWQPETGLNELLQDVIAHEMSNQETTYAANKNATGEFIDLPLAIQALREFSALGL